MPVWCATACFRDEVKPVAQRAAVNAQLRTVASSALVIEVGQQRHHQVGTALGVEVHRRAERRGQRQGTKQDQSRAQQRSGQEICASPR